MGGRPCKKDIVIAEVNSMPVGTEFTSMDLSIKLMGKWRNYGLTPQVIGQIVRIYCEGKTVERLEDVPSKWGRVEFISISRS